MVHTMGMGTHSKTTATSTFALGVHTTDAKTPPSEDGNASGGGSLLAQKLKRANSFVGVVWIPKGKNMSMSDWRTTNAFLSSKGQIALEIKRMDNGPHSVKILLLSEINKRFDQKPG